MRKFPKAPPPAEDAAQRLRQMKDLVRQIRARESSRLREQSASVKPVQFYELRVLPQPVHRYADAKSGLIDGGMFLIAYGLNPEVILLMEARREGPSGPEWYCGCARDLRSWTFKWISRVRKSGPIEGSAPRGLTTRTGSSPGRSWVSDDGDGPPTGNATGLERVRAGVSFLSRHYALHSVRDARRPGRPGDPDHHPPDVPPPGAHGRPGDAPVPQDRAPRQTRGGGSSGAGCSWRSGWRASP